MKITSEKFEFSTPIASLGIHGVDQFSGLWAIDPLSFRNFAGGIAATNLNAHVQSNDGLRLPTFAEDGLTVVDGRVAVIRLSGVMSKRGSSFNFNGSTLRVRQEFLAAERDDNIESVLFVIESPGGTTSGTKELGDLVARVAEKKKVVAVIEDIGASAAYWAASQATEVYANGPAVVGSIGTYLTVADYSKMYEDAGVTVHLIKAGEGKGVGTPGIEITEEQIAKLQQMVDSTNEFFTSAVQSGRNFTDKQLAAVANGHAFMADEALSLGLIDGVSSFDDALNSLLNSEGIQMKSLLHGKALDDVKTDDETSAEDSVTETSSEDVTPETPSEPVTEPTSETNVEPTSETPAVDVNSNLQRFVSTFGAEAGAKFVLDNKSFEDACIETIASLREENQNLKSNIEALESSEAGRLSGKGNDAPKTGEGLKSKLRFAFSEN